MDPIEGVDGVINIGRDGFVFTEDMDFRAQIASLVGSSLSLGLSLFICLASLWIYSVPSARRHLDRVSFRLLLWSMGVEVVYNAVYLYIFSDPAPRMQYPVSCSAAVYFLVATMGTANWLCTCIGVNLMLAICFGINPVRARLERWYILASFLLGFGLSLIPAAMGDFGPDELYQACYFTETQDGERIQDFILDLYLWQLLSCAVAAGSVAAVLLKLLRQSRATERALFRANDLNITSRDLREITSASHSHVSHVSKELTAVPEKWHHRLVPAWLDQRHKNREQQAGSRLHRLEDKFITIALKISLYPLALIMINAFITTEDLVYTVRGGVRSQAGYVLYCIYYFLYGGRGIFFAVLGIFVDPCLRNGLPAAYQATFRSGSRPAALAGSPSPADLSTTEAQIPAPRGSQGGDDGPESIADFLSSAEAGTTLYASDPAQSRKSRAGVISAWRWRRVRVLSGWSGKTLSGREEGSEGRTRLQLSSRDVEEQAVEPEDKGMLGRDEKGMLGTDGMSPERPLRHGDFPPDTDVSEGETITLRPAAPERPAPALVITIDPRPFLAPAPPHSALALCPPPPALRPTTSTSSIASRQDTWLAPLASAVLAPPVSPLGPRRSSDPAMGTSDRRRRELRIAAEKMYAEAQAQL